MTPKPAPRKRSIRELPPLETGGIIARRGMDLQDHLAARFCLDMLTLADGDPAKPLEVWNERQDDITLILPGDRRR